ncbi:MULTISPECIES: aminotransferase class V-fold PLP-dependent enzyme [Amycolatopsis]|uniref:Kynureninase n=1 Tax=Amycolatopsis albidoflavus TaxID=102226 RepID=A0ABW5I989_9PSEU
MTIQPRIEEDGSPREKTDPISSCSQEYALDGRIHLNGNSLGAPRHSLIPELGHLISGQWARLQVRGWFQEGWLDLPRTVGDKLGALLGAKPGQIVVAGETTSTTLFNVLVAACRLRADRPVLLVEQESFPTDLYIAASVARLLDRRLAAVSRADLDIRLREHGDQVAAALTSPVDFRTGERRGIGETTALCHDAGAISVWDLSHAAGVLPVDLDANGVDLAIGCGYKYLGGGPGAPAFTYVPVRHQPDVDFPLAGWHGHARPFAMSPRFEPADGIDRARTGTPPVLSLAGLNHALDPLLEAGIEALYQRTRELGDYFLACLEESRPDLAKQLASPRDALRRGGHLAVRVADAERVEHELAERGVHVDSRPPDLIRFAFAPLYVTKDHIRRVVDIVTAVA